MSQLTDRVVLITGGASGLGRAIALASAEVGANVAIMDLPSERLDSAHNEVLHRAVDCLALGADLTKEVDITAAIEKTLARWGHLDTVVNNAGVYYYGPIITTPVEQFDHVYGVNVRGLFLVCREAARVMLPRMSGHIILFRVVCHPAVPRDTSLGTVPWDSRELGSFWPNCAVSQPAWSASDMPDKRAACIVVPGFR